MTATIAAAAGGGLALAVHDSSPGAPRDCGLVPCAAALPASVRSGGAASAGATATASPTAIHRASTPSSSAPAAPATGPEAAPPPAQPASAEPVSASEPLSSAAPVASSAGRAVSADRAIGVAYAITGDSHHGIHGIHGIHGEFVIVNSSSAPVSGWRVTVVLPGDTGYQVQNAGNLSAGDALVMTAPRKGQALAGGGTELIAFTARGTTSTPARCTFTESARPQATRDGTGGRGSGAAGHNSAAGDQARAARDGHDGWPAAADHPPAVPRRPVGFVP